MSATVMEKCSSAVRGVFIAPKGKKFVIADLSNIEGRVLAWLAGEEWKLQAFRDFDTVIGWDDKKQKPIRMGFDLYILAYAKAFGCSPEDVDDFMRQIGKTMELALGYAGGVGAFITFSLAFNIDLELMAKNAWDAIPEAMRREARDFLEWHISQGKSTYGLSEEAFIVCESFKRLWREAHPNTVSYWKELENACRSAISNPGRTLTCRRHKIRRDGAWLRVMLPSGRYLCYPSPRVEDDGQITYMGINQYSRKWERLRTYSGKLAENVTQASARDVLASSMQPIESAGYEIVLTVHDEVIAEAPDDPAFSHSILSALMAQGEDWTEGLPLAAAGFEAYRYRKG